eukprot:374357-Amphidinium_carterae.1
MAKTTKWRRGCGRQFTKEKKAGGSRIHYKCLYVYVLNLTAQTPQTVLFRTSQLIGFKHDRLLDLDSAGQNSP